jgi:regulator of sigma E protease
MLLTIVSFILVLGVLVFVHELGHYLAARHVGVRVEQFSIGFPPRMVGRKWGETEYLISWIPIGGYVRLFGQNLEDENPHDPRNYAAKSVWQRLYILVAGPLANLVLALMVMPLVYAAGVDEPAYRTQAPVIAAVEAGSAAERLGIAAEDRVLRVGGDSTPTWNDVFAALERHATDTQPVALDLSHAGNDTTFLVPVSDFTGSSAFGWLPRIEPVAGRVAPNTPAEKAGIRSGDRILTVDGVSIGRWEEISRAIQKAQGQAMQVTVDRGGETVPLEITAQLSAETKTWLIGISPAMHRQSHGPIAAFLQGTKRIGEITGMTFAFLGNLVTGHGSMDQVGGPVKIGAFIGEAARTSLSSLAFLMAVISLQLGIFNLLPIPALDGGHVFFFLLPEIVHLRLRWQTWVTRKRRRFRLPLPQFVFWTPLQPKLRAQIQTVGMTALILLMVFITYHDIVQLLS